MNPTDNPINEPLLLLPHSLPSLGMRVPYPRPTRLSDPHYDFTPELLEDLLRVPDAQLGRVQFINLLGPHLPAGTYEEVVYFLPLALDHLLTHEEDALEVVTSIVGFVSVNAERLRQDGLLEGAVDALRQCWDQWTSTFRVRHFDRDACRAKGWGPTYSNYVQGVETVVTITQDLVRFETLAELAVELVRGLAYPEEAAEQPTRAAIQSAWFLEYARCRADVYSPPDYAPITALLIDKELLRRAAYRVRRSAHIAAAEASRTYWRDTFGHLRI